MDDKYDQLLVKMRKKFYDRYEHVKRSSSDGLNDFKKIIGLGEGSFGRVVLVKNDRLEKYFAMKMFEKAKVKKMKQLEHTLCEKQMLQSVDFPFVISMDFCFKDNVYLYFVMPFINGGDLFFHLKRLSKFDENLAKFYAAQVLLGIEYLHTSDILYRDLKPENILVQISGYLKLSDLGFCKIVKTRTWTLCGTPEYIAPEIILSKGYGKAVDWWSFGVLIFEMNAGYSPFCSRDPMTIYEKIISGKFKIPAHFSLQLLDLVKNILQIDLSRRYGNLKGGSADIKHHKWFNNINFFDIYEQKIKPPFSPSVTSPGDVSNFDTFALGRLKTDSQNIFEKEFADF